MEVSLHIFFHQSCNRHIYTQLLCVIIKLLGLIQIFTLMITHGHTPDIHPTMLYTRYRLVEAMETYQAQTEQKQLPQFSNEFPDSITVDQAVAAWKHIVLYQEKLRRD